MEEKGVRPALRYIARWVGAGLASGFLSGLVIGGVGGRLAMFVLRLTSDPSLVGAKTDDGFVMGRFSADTGFLILFCAFTGAVGGVGYVLIRGLLPQRRRWRVAVTGLLAALVGGSVVVHPEGIDFKVLSPLWLAIAMFVALPALYGAATSAMAENLGTRTSNRVIPWLAILAPLALLPAIGVGTDAPLVAAGVVLVVALAVVSTVVPAVRQVVLSGTVIWLGRTALAAAGAGAGFLLVKDIVAILGVVY